MLGSSLLRLVCCCISIHSLQFVRLSSVTSPRLFHRQFLQRLFTIFHFIFFDSRSRSLALKHYFIRLCCTYVYHLVRSLSLSLFCFEVSFPRQQRPSIKTKDKLLKEHELSICRPMRQATALSVSLFVRLVFPSLTLENFLSLTLSLSLSGCLCMCVYILYMYMGECIEVIM